MGGLRLRFQKGDMLVVAGVVLLAALVFVLFVPGSDLPAGRAEVYQDGKLIKTILLSQDQEFTVEGQYTGVIAVRDGKVAVIQSDCPGEDCVGCGWVGSPGKSIVCLPNRLEIRVVTGSADVDFVVG